jgi:hypothetical protein
MNWSAETAQRVNADAIAMPTVVAKLFCVRRHRLRGDDADGEFDFSGVSN